MDMHLKKTQQEPGPQTRDTGQDPAGQIPLDVTGNGSKTCTDHISSVGASSEFEDGRLPPISTLYNKLKTVPERLDTPRDTAGEPLNPDPVHLTTSPVLRGDSPVTSFTIPPTEEDLKQLQSGQDKNGYIKRPPNAFIVWSHIHRQYALRKICPGADMIDTSIVLGCEWSKLSQEEKRPYYEVAHKLKYMHRQQFPDYEFRPQKKKVCLSSGQGAGQYLGISFSQAVAPAQSQLKEPSIHPWPTMMPYYTVGYHPYPRFIPCHQMGLHSGINRPRFFCPNAGSSTEEVKNYHHTHLQRDQSSSESLKQPDVDTRPQRPATNKECKRVDDVDVVGVSK